MRIFRPGIGQLGAYLPRAVSLPAIQSSGGLTDRALPKISIVVPSFNQGRFIAYTLQSLVDQQYPNLELIIIDGGSTDDTVSVIKRYESYISSWVSEPDAGQTSAINKGFARSTGEIMAWINSDDMVVPGTLNYIGHYFLKSDRAQVVYGNRILIDENGQEIGRWVLPWHSNRVLRWIDFVPQETLYWRRSAWDSIGAKLDESFRFAMDWDFLLRLSARGINIEHVSLFLGLFRVHGQQKTLAQMSSIGQAEMKTIRRRELGFQPTRNWLRWNTALFLLAAKLRELGLRAGI